MAKRKKIQISKAEKRARLTPDEIESEQGLFLCPTNNRDCRAYCLNCANKRAPKGKQYVRGYTGVLKLVKAHAKTR